MQKNQKLKHDFVQHSANLDDFKCVINGNVRLDELKLRLMREYPAFLYNGKLAIFDQKTYLVENCIAIPNHHSLYTQSFLELPLRYSCYEHYMTAKTLWSGGHNSISIGNKFINKTLNQNSDIFDIKGNSFLVRWHDDQDNYWHWTFDSYINLLNLYLENIDLFKEIENIVFLSPKELSRFQVDYLTILKELHPRINILHIKGPCKMQNCILHQSTYPIIHHPEKVSRIRDLLYEKLKISQKQPKLNLYIRRGETRNGRRLKNEYSLEQHLKQYSFKPINCGKLSLYDQINAFSECKIAIGVHGSAFVNMLFMQQGTSLIELMSDSYDPIHDLILAENLKINYYELFFKSESLDFSSDLIFHDDAKPKIDHMLNRLL